MKNVLEMIYLIVNSSHVFHNLVIKEQNCFQNVCKYNIKFLNLQ